MLTACGGGGSDQRASPTGPPAAGTAGSASPAAAGASGAGSDAKHASQALSSFFGGSLVPETHGAFGLDRTAVGPGSAPLGAALTVQYPTDSASTRSSKDDGTAHGGAQVYLRLAAGSSDDLHLRYYLRLPAGFTWVKGGKLPGLFGGTVTSGRHIPNGTNGFSTRYMWRRGGAGEVYAYLPSSVAHGTSLGRGSWTWPTGRWVSVEQEVHLNAPGRNDGFVVVWLDGRQVLKQDGLIFRTSPDLRIDGVFFSSFFGGGDESWATPRSQSAEFAAFAVSPRYIGPLPDAP